MNPPETGWCSIALRLVVGAVFVWAGLVKIENPQDFAKNISSFQMLPLSLVNFVSICLPVFEVVLGGMLLCGMRVRCAALGVVLLTAIFAFALSAALFRGLIIDCGCFGGDKPSREGVMLALVRDLLLLCTGMFLYWMSSHQQ